MLTSIMIKQSAAAHCVQVSAFGSDEQSDEGDIWQVDWDKAGSTWLRDQKVRPSQHPHTRDVRLHLQLSCFA